ncbi:receptor-type tyrosine-protein phosphatase O [Hyalella azteca]|uniref:Receptor-type tyrosine-protein phosphatase O n=1 Tax=Hyalella azteca TaxID=294128 RepID=A0A979FFZ6_HYAAZ|nr:receptor-type tyrosine-protein phosphatase O [Hyalella azteca]
MKETTSYENYTVTVEENVSSKNISICIAPAFNSTSRNESCLELLFNPEEKCFGRMPFLAVQSLIINSLDCHGITLNWKTQPVPLCKVTRYLLSYSSTPLAQSGHSPLEDVQQNITINPSSHSYTISDPHSLSVYNVCVVAEYTSGFSTSTCIQNTTGDLAGFIASHELETISAGQNSLTISWTPPECPDRVTRYGINATLRNATQNASILAFMNSSDCSDPQSGVSQVAGRNTSSRCVFTIHNLQPGQDYRVVVTAYTNDTKIGTDISGIFYTFESRETEVTTRNLVNDKTILLIVSVGSCIGGLSIIALCIFYCRKKSRVQTLDSEEEGRSIAPNVTSTRRQMYCKELMEKMDERRLENILERETLFEEFALLDEKSPKKSTANALKEENASYNRSGVPLPFDSSRVVLQRQTSNLRSDYINASYVTSTKGPNLTFIAAQSPMDETVLSFWQMIWQQRAKIVVMIASWEEQNEIVSALYLPTCEDPTLECGPFTIELTEEVNIDDVWYERTLAVSDGIFSLQLLHYQFVAWPSQGSKLPDAEVFCQFQHTVRFNTNENESTVVVHCNNGSGRTGTFLALWNVLLAAETREGHLSVTDVVRDMRECRSNLVENKKQFVFLLNCCTRRLTSPTLVANDDPGSELSSLDSELIQLARIEPDGNSRPNSSLSGQIIRS